MPFAGLGLHILLALLCAIHVVRTGQPMYWLFILFAFPLLGSLVYFFAVYLPRTRLERGAMKAVSAAVKAIDPTREVREARAAYDERKEFRPETISLLIARALAGSSRVEEARAEFESAVARFGTYQVKAEYAIWASAVGDAATADRLFAELDKIASRWSPHTRELNEPIARRLRAARDLARQRPQNA